MWSLSFRIEKWLFAVHGGRSRGETRLKWPISQSARGKWWRVAKEVAVGEVGASILDLEVSDVLFGKDKARASCCRLLRILIARRLNVIGFLRWSIEEKWGGCLLGKVKGVVRWRRSSHDSELSSRIGVHRPNRSLSVKMVPLLSIATEHRFGMTRGMSKWCAVLFARHANVTPDCTVTGTADSRTVTQYLLGETESKSGYRIE